MTPERLAEIERYVGGPLGFPATDRQMIHELIAEIARLRAEVERLTLRLANLNDVADDRKQWWLEAQRERDEALAQVAVLAQEAQIVVDNHEKGFSCQDGVAQELPHLLKNLPTEARALLDRLRRAEVVVEAVRKRREFFEQEYGWICRGPQPWSAGVSEQDRIEFEALAAWEESVG